MLSVMVSGTKRFGWHHFINARVQEKTLASLLCRAPITFTDRQLSWTVNGFGGVPQSGHLLSCHTDILCHSRPLCFSCHTLGTVAVTFHLVRLQGTLELPASSTASSSRAVTLGPPGINEPYLGTHELHKLKN